MIIKKAEYKKVMVEKKRCISPGVYGCDECKKEIKEYPNETERLEMTIFKNSDQPEYLHFCSWECVLKYIPKIKTDYFVTLPYLFFDCNKKSKKGGNELIRLLKKKIG